MPLLEFPKIAEIEDGQVLGASQLNTYQRACDYLLGKSHATYALGFGTETLEYGGDTYEDQIYLRCYHEKKTLFYAFQARCQVTPGSGPWHVSIQVYNDLGSWEEIVYETGENQAWAFFEGTVDLSVYANITAGQQYRWRIRTKVDFAYVYLRLYGLGEQEAISGWVAPPTYTNGVTSAQADFNAVRTDLRALHTMLPPVADMGNMGYDLERTYLKVDASSAETFMVAGFRYRPESILFNARIKTGEFRGPGFSETWEWRLVLRDTAGNEATIWDSGTLTDSYWGQYRWWGTEEVDLTTGDAATAISNAGITLTMGDWYQIEMIFERPESGTYPSLSVKGGFLARQSDLSVSAGWPSFTAWSVGDDDIGNARLTKFSDALTELYTGGDEELWGQHRAVGAGDTGEGRRTCGFYGVHAKRWLVFYESDGGTIHYGANFSDTYRLSDGDGWGTLDLTKVGIPWGGVYIITDIQAAWEADTAYG